MDRRRKRGRGMGGYAGELYKDLQKLDTRDVSGVFFWLLSGELSDCGATISKRQKGSGLAVTIASTLSSINNTLPVCN